jgi:hypothetical protein
VREVADIDKEEVSAIERISDFSVKATILTEDELQLAVNLEAVTVGE